MNNNSHLNSSGQPRTIDKVMAGIAKRRRSEKIFRALGITAIVVSILFLGIFFTTIIRTGLPAFRQTHIALVVYLDPEQIDPDNLAAADYQGFLKAALREEFPHVTGRREKRALYKLVSGGAGIKLHKKVAADPGLIGTTQTFWLPTDDEIDLLMKGQVTPITKESSRGIGSVVEKENGWMVLSSANDFTSILTRVKQKQEKELQAQRAELPGIERRLAKASENEKERLARDLERQQERVEALQIKAETPGGEARLTPDLPSFFVRINDGLIKVQTVANTYLKGTAVWPLASTADAAAGQWGIETFITPEDDRRVKDDTVIWAQRLMAHGKLEKRFNTTFFTAGDSREPEQAGIWGAMRGSFFTLLVALLLSFPIGVAAAVYLEEFAPKNRWTDLIEVNINNLAAVPSIVFGLLGLAIYINFFGLPRSVPLVGGLVLTLMTLPTIIIAGRASLKSVPPSIREAALGVGASKMQMISHHVLPLAMPGMLTGTIIGMAQALGETAPLLMIGMVAFIVDIPNGFLDPATVLPVQIYLWADSPERAFTERTSAAIIVLLGFLILMNGLAVVLRKKFERRW